MRNIFIAIILFSFYTQSFAQAPAPASNPMTAPGAIGVYQTGHTLFWKNPIDVDYNEVYFSPDSALVANLNPSVRILNGFPDTVHTSLPLNNYGGLDVNVKYYWRVVEFNSSGNTASPLWYFKSKSPASFGYDHFFNSGMEGWQIIGPMGFNNWYWSNSSHTGSNPGEMVFRWDPIFIGDSYLMSPEFPAAANSYMILGFKYYEDWWSDTVVVGCAYTTDDGNSWTSIWELRAAGNVGPEVFITDLYVPGNFRLGFYYLGDSNNIDFLYIDEVGMGTALSVALPPSFLQAEANDVELKVQLQWDPGSSPAPPAPVTGYQIQRKSGLPTSTSSYQTIANVDSQTFSFEDLGVELNHTYTYRICTEIGPGLSTYGNEATAYVPLDVPVELVSFNASVVRDEVTLNWITATEMNNSGFEIQKKESGESRQETEWKAIGFVEGNGTTTEQNFYSFVDRDLKTGNYQFRLKQIDFDGTYSYSNTIEVEISTQISFSLEQNFPNPFNPSTNIKYSIPSDGNVSLKVYDVLGKLVFTLVDENKQAGTFDVTFDGSNLSSGVYYYRLTAGEMTATKKLMLMK